MRCTLPPPAVLLAALISSCADPTAQQWSPGEFTPQFFMLQTGGPTGTACVRSLTNVPSNWNRDDHFSQAPADSFTMTFADPSAPPLAGQCGDLEFDGRTRSFTARYTPTFDADGNWRYWWRRGRRADGLPSDLLEVSKKNRAVGVPDTVTVQMPLLTAYDGLGAMFWMHTSDTLVISEAAFTDPTAYGTTALHHVYVQHWARANAPILDSARVVANVVTLWWTNQHNGRPIDSTMVFRDGTERKLRPGTATSHVDTVPGPGTYTYTLKHVSPPIVVVTDVDPLVEPNSPQSAGITVTIGDPPPPPPPPLMVGWLGPSVLRPNTTCTWTADVMGGTTPYTYSWTRNGVVVSAKNKWTGSATSSFILRLTVTSGDGQVQYQQEQITISPTWPPGCQSNAPGF